MVGVSTENGNSAGRTRVGDTLLQAVQKSRRRVPRQGLAQEDSHGVCPDRSEVARRRHYGNPADEIGIPVQADLDLLHDRIVRDREEKVAAGKVNQLCVALTYAVALQGRAGQSSHERFHERVLAHDLGQEHT